VNGTEMNLVHALLSIMLVAKITICDENGVLKKSSAAGLLHFDVGFVDTTKDLAKQLSELMACERMSVDMEP